MEPALAIFQSVRKNRRMLLVAAAPAEARAVLGAMGGDAALADQSWRLHEISARCDMVVCGIGKSNAAGAVGRFLDTARHACVISVGVCGSLPGGPAIGAAVLGTAAVYADEGLHTPDGFIDCHAMGFPLGPFTGSSISADPELRDALRSTTDEAVPIATVSTCSGTDALAAQVAARTGAAAEAMEGAAVLHVAARLGVSAAEVRVVSNTTGDRGRQKWALKPALERLREVIARW